MLAVYRGDAFYDITPLASTVATCTITSTTGSSTVTINKTSHGLEEGALLIFDNVTIPAGCSFTTAEFTTNTFEIQAASTNSFNVVMTSTETGGGASAGTGQMLNLMKSSVPSIKLFNMDGAQELGD